MRRLFVKHILKELCLRTSITEISAQQLRSLFVPSSIQMPTATGKLEVGKPLQCESASQVFKSEALMISAIKALGSTFAMARAPSPAQLLVGHRDLVDGTASLKQLGALRNSRRLSDGNDGSRHFEGRFLGLVGDQLEQEWNE